MVRGNLKRGRQSLEGQSGLFGGGGGGGGGSRGEGLHDPLGTVMVVAKTPTEPNEAQ